jgi:hypothetical protein
MAQTVTHEFSFSLEDLQIREFEDYEFIRYGDCGYINDPGKPWLPVVRAFILLPSGAKVTSFQTTSRQMNHLEGEHTVLPCQPPIPIGSERPGFVPPDGDVYSSTTPYPPEPVLLVDTGSRGGFNVASLILFPLQYLPAERRLVFNRTLTIQIDYELGTPIERSKRQIELHREMLETCLKNPEDLARFAPRNRGQSKGSVLLDEDDVAYVIVTTSEYASIFQELADWKTKKGVPSEIVELSYITTTYAGEDTQQQIRNFIMDADSTWGTVYFLLAGDPSNGTIPTRLTTDLGLGPYGTIGSDLYYSDLDGDWDGDGDGTYGETSDDVDMYSDVLVGRASVGSAAEAQDFVDKVLTYEKNPPSGYLQRELLPSELLFSESNYWGDTCGNAIADITPDNFTVCKLYESTGNLSAQSVLDSIDAGYHLVHYTSHGNYNVISTGPNSVYSSDADGLINGDRLGVHIAICCIVGRLDYEDCIVEHFMSNIGNGTVAWVGNSRYGWGSPPALGPAENIDIAFFNNLFHTNLAHIGALVTAAKDQYVPYAVTGQYYRYSLYELNLFGDPEMMVWTREPEPLAVEYPAEVVPGLSDFVLRATHNGLPVGGALVCVMGGDEVYAYGHTLPSGEISLSIDPATVETLLVTVTAHNHLPYESFTLVAQDGPYLVHESHLLSDGEDGSPNPGDTLDVSVTLANQGLQTGYDVVGLLYSGDPWVSIQDSLATFGDITPGGTSSGSTDYRIAVSPSCTNSQWIGLAVEARDSSDGVWTSYFSIVVEAPVLTYTGNTLDDGAGGNGNGIAEPGETVDLWVSAMNGGLAPATDVSGQLTSTDPYFTVVDPTVDFADIEPGQTEASLTSFTLSVDPGCPDPSFPMLLLEVTSDGCTVNDSFVIAAGTPGFADSMEAGEGGWTHHVVTAGYEDQWHLETYRYGSPSHSWKCGGPGSFDYTDLLDAALISPPMVILPGSRLHFSHWISAEVFDSEEAWDGGIVEITTDLGATWTQIEPVGGYPYVIYPNPASPFEPGTPCYSGTMGWTEAEFDLSQYSGGIQLRFRFGSDGYTTEEGWYVDDVAVTSPARPQISVTPSSVVSDVAQGDTTSESLSISNVGQATLQFDVTISAGSGWLTVEPADGEVLPDSSFSLVLTLDGSGLAAGDYDGEVQVRSNDPVDSLTIVPVGLTVMPVFVRGDVSSSGELGMEDAVQILRFKYVPGTPPLECMDAGDSDDSGEITMTDAIGILRHLYVPGTPPLPQPFPQCGIDPTPDDLDCGTHACMQALVKKREIMYNGKITSE